MVKVTNDSHIVMVDDNDGDTFLAEQCFEESRLRNPWLSFSNGPDFLAYLAGIKAGVMSMPAIVLLDVNMPGMNGLEVLGKARSDPFFAAEPTFCMLTSSRDPRDRKGAIELGASAFLTKPSNISDYVELFDSLA